jgi:hypothetical protein
LFGCSEFLGHLDIAYPKAPNSTLSLAFYFPRVDVRSNLDRLG